MDTPVHIYAFNSYQICRTRKVFDLLVLPQVNKGWTETLILRTAFSDVMDVALVAMTTVT